MGDRLLNGQTTSAQNQVPRSTQPQPALCGIHLGAEPGTQVYSASARPLWHAVMSTRQKLEE